MALIRANTGGGGGADNNLVEVYKNGTWNTSLKSLFSMYNVTEGNNSLVCPAAQGSGIYTNSVISNDYIGALFVTNGGSHSWGTINNGATLPTIATTGAGRGSYFWGTREQGVADCINGGVYTASTGAVGGFEIYGIYLIKPIS